ncbi:MAG: M20/M25/M40 family metallo-hydrolase, partial [Solirubrobacterales bacterium]
EELHSRPPLERTPAIAAAAERARALGSLLGLELGEGSAGGVSDGNLAAAEGTPVLDGLGPQGDGAHGFDEQVSLASLVERTALMALLIAEL